MSPARFGKDLLIGDIASGKAPHDGARAMAIDRQTGRLDSMTQVEKNQAAIITGAPALAVGTVLDGVSSPFAEVTSLAVGSAKRGRPTN